MTIVCSMASSLFAQGNAVVYGSVYDSETSEPVIGATIATNTNEGTVTDLDGRYRLDLKPGTYELKFSYLGYSSKKKSITLQGDQIKELDIALDESKTELGIVVVSASLYEKNIAEETVSMDVISKDLVSNTNSRELGEIVAKTPGVQVQDGQVSIRGGSSYSYGIGSRTAVLLDGLGFASADLGEAQLKSAPVENIDQVEVIKGSSSVVYGSSALNGVVNVRTAWPGEVPQTSITSYVGIYDKPKREELIWWGARQPAFQGIFLNHEQKVNNMQYVIGGNFDFIQSFLQDADEFRFRGNWKTRYILPKNPGVSFGVNGNLVKETSGRFFLAEDLDSNAYRIREGSEDRYVRTNIDPHFTYVNDNGHRFSFNGRWINIYRRGNGDDPNAVSNNIETQTQYQKKWGDRFVLTTGIPINFGKSRSNLYELERVNYFVAAYAQGEVKFGNLSLVGGVRYEVNKVDTFLEKSIPVFRTGLNYKVGKATYFRASWGQSYRLPTIAERYIAADLIPGVFIIPNPELVPERGWGAEIGVKQGLKIKNWVGYADVAVFWMEYKDFVEYRLGIYDNADPSGNPWFPGEADRVIGPKPFNVENARIFGWEASVAGTGNIGPVQIATLMGYTYSYAGSLEDTVRVGAGEFIGDAFSNFTKRITEEEDLSKILYLRSRHTVRGDIQFTYRGISLGYSLYYNSFPERLPDIFGIFGPTLEKYVEEHEKGDLVMDARFAYRINERFKMSFIVKNLTNKEYSTRPGKLEPPRSYTVQFNVTLNHKNK